MPPDTAHADPALVRRTALATAVYDALAGFGPDPYPAQLAASVGWTERDFAAAVERVVAVARREMDGRPAGMSQPMALMTSNNTDEWYTPAWVLALARECLNGIELDPASSAAANTAVQAERYYTHDDDGYRRDWRCRSLWLNPPFSDTARWARRLAAAYADGDVGVALLLVNSAPGYTWYEELADVWPAVQLRKRLAFVRADGGVNKDKGGLAKKSQTIFYFGPDVARFESVFSPYGRRLHAPQPQPRGLFEEAA